MRILHCIQSLDLGGSQRQLALLSRELPRHGWDVHIAALTGGSLAPTLDPATPLHLVAHSRDRDVCVPLRLARLIGRLQPAIVQTWGVKMDILGGMAALVRGVPWIATERSSALGYPPHWSTRMRSWLVRRADGLVANSAGGLDLWRNVGGPPTQWLIRNGFADVAATETNGVPPTPTQSPPLPPLLLPDVAAIAGGSAALIVYAGRLVAEKRLHVLLHACARVQRDRRAVVVLCGTGPLEPELRRMAQALGLHDMVVFAGFVRDMDAVLRRADVFVSVSAVEGSPNAVQEAMACGTPVVLSDIPAHRELADERAACLVDGDDAEAVAAGLVECLRNRDDARARAETALSIARAWSAATMGSEYDAVYRDVLEARSRCRSRTS